MNTIYQGKRRLALLALLLLLSGAAACDGTEGDGGEVQPQEDVDRDGVLAEDDCDDDDPEVGLGGVFYRDTDGDGLGDPRSPMQACQAPEGYVSDDTDTEPECATNDTDDCGVCGGDGSQTFYADVDGDGAGDDRSQVLACARPQGYVTQGGDPEPDCATDDTDDCGVCGGPGSMLWYADADGDGVGDEGFSVRSCEQPGGYVAAAGDPEPGCATDDTDDCGVCGGPGSMLWYADVDGDGVGDQRISVQSCAQPEGFVQAAGDPEPDCATDDTDDCGVCAGGDRDKDCNGVCFGASVVDDCGVCDGPGAPTWYADADQDGLGDPGLSLSACERPEGFVDNDGDAEPLCATNDTDDCGVCAGPGPQIWYPDLDQDGLGDARSPLEDCQQPLNFVDNGNDPEPGCATNDTDDCGVCGGENRSQDCAGVCDGEAVFDGCSRCVGGTTGQEAAVDDSDGDGTPDMCDNDCQFQSRFIVQWTSVPPYSGNGGPYTFQLILYESGNILIQHGNIEPYMASPNMGIQEAGGQQVLNIDNGFIQDHPAFFMFRESGTRYLLDYAQPLYWLDISREGLGTPLTLGDDTWETVDIGFDFPLYEQTHSRIAISSNGLVALDPADEAQPFSGSHSNQRLPVSNAADMGLIAALWDDLNPTRGGTVHYYLAPPSCEADCNGVPGGLAFTEDSCGACVTGLETEPPIDCNGDCGGTAAIDGCGRCAGGNTELEPMNMDCTGQCGGTAYYDACNICVGGDTGLEPSDPASCPQGVDLVVDQDDLRDTIRYDTINIAEGDCLIQERCVGGSGTRRLIRFATTIANIGTEDLQLGSRAEGDYWHYDACHNHYHFEAYAGYQVYDVANEEMLDIGAKTGFAVIDIGVYDPNIATNGCVGYNSINQGITAGCYDRYSSGLSCQWVDVTELPDGLYDIIVTTNPEGEIPEISLDNNAARVRVRLEGESVTVVEEQP
jgi:hypothetical protein